MIDSIDQANDLTDLFVSNTVQRRLKDASNVMIKINLARPPIKYKHPRTDRVLLQSVLSILIDHGKSITVCESADGHLSENLDSIDILSYMESRSVQYVDIDTVEFYKTSIDDQEILIPKFFNDFDIRVSIPCASKREGMLFSNNIKNYFGATPRIGYMEPGKGRERSILHHNLTKSIINVYDAFEQNSKFDYFINGGNAYSEERGAFEINEFLLSDDAIELDKHIFDQYFSHDIKPDYLIQLEKRLSQH